METFIFLLSTNTLDNEACLARLTTLFQEHPSLVDPDIESPIAMAIEFRCPQEIVSFLLERGCPIDKKASGCTPLSLAIRLGRSDLVDLFLSHGANHYKKSGTYMTPSIVYAAQQLHNTVPMLERLLQYDTHHINWTDRHSVTALRSAAKYGNLEAARLLLSRGADPTIADKNGLTPLDMCRSNEFLPSHLYFSEHILANLKNRKQIATLLEEEERAYLVFKGKALSNARFVATHYYPRDCWSLNHLPEVVKKRMVYKRPLPSLFFTTSGLRPHPGAEVMEFEKPSLVQEVIHEVWLRSNSDVFKELMSFLVV